MSAQIRKSENIQGKVFFLNGQGQEKEVLNEYSDFELQGPYEQVLTFLGTDQQFAPNGPANTFKEGVQYTLVSLTGNELTIIANAGPPPQWIPVD
ncbi:MAG: hypothetical protein GY940_27515 [bacterium]|nr:hypothetical protein [bacterium]